jgi:hypothetical protein
VVRGLAEVVTEMKTRKLGGRCFEVQVERKVLVVVVVVLVLAVVAP